MRFLKNKIARANAVKTQGNTPDPKTLNLDLNLKLNPEYLTKNEQTTQDETIPSSKSKRVPGLNTTSEESKATKNIVKNYGKAICKFITSRFALPYLHKIISKEGVRLHLFIQFVNKAKTSIDGLAHFRSILLSHPTDNKQTTIYRRIFREMSEVFIKFYSVNWIYNSKMIHKNAHLSFRLKILRRIKHPELFTYLKN